MLRITQLHLMNDRKVIATESVEGNLHVPFRKLMDSLIEDIDTNWISDSFDINDDVKNIMKYDAEKAKKHPPVRSKISEFHTGDPAIPQSTYSVVVHYEERE